MAIFGKSDFSVRFPSALAGTLTIFIVFFLFKELLEIDKKTKNHANTIALVGSAIFAILPWHLQFSRAGFEVCVALFFYSVGLLLGIYYLKTKKWQYLLGVILFLSFSEYTYQAYRIISPLSIFIVTFVAFFKEKRIFKDLLIAFVVFIIFSFPLILFSLTPQGQARLLGTSAFSQKLGLIGYVKDIVIFVNSYLSYFSLTFLFHLGDQINRHQVQNFGLLYLWQLPFCIAGVYFLTKTKNTLLRFVAVFLFLIAPVAPAIALPSPQTLRFLLGTIPFTLLTTLGIYQVFTLKKTWTKFLLMTTIVAVILSFTYFLDYYFVQYPKESQIDWGSGCKQITYQLEEDYSKYDTIIVDKNLGCVPEYFSFYVPFIPVEFVGESWVPDKSKNKKVLYIRPFYGKNNPENLEENVYIKNVNHDIFAQFYSL
jgi:4-amino-4-deoxy-L-arabinose transferase-like glycosyltransferase